METFEEIFCRRHGCTCKQFKNKLFWMCLYRHAIPFAPFIFLVARDYYSADFELIGGVGRATEISEVWEESRHYFLNPTYRGWLRRKLNVRVSAHRLIMLAESYLSSSTKLEARSKAE